MSSAPTFSGWRAVVLHRADEGTSRLARQLGLLGMTTTVLWAPLDVSEDTADIVMVDADQGWDDLLPWSLGKATVPLVALLQSEAPGRIMWAIERGASTVIAKPISASAVYPAVVMAVSIHAERKAAAERVARLEELVKMRPLVHGAVRSIQEIRAVDENTAYDLLRRMAMIRRLTLEQTAGDILTGAVSMMEER